MVGGSGSGRVGAEVEVLSSGRGWSSGRNGVG